MKRKKHHWSNYPFLRRNRWPDFWFTMGVRAFFGLVFGTFVGLLVGFCVFWALYGQRSEYVGGKIILRWDTHYATTRLIIWFVAWGLIGILVAILKTPDWQRPWYRRVATTNMAWQEEWRARLAAKETPTSPAPVLEKKKGEAKGPRRGNLFEKLSYWSEPIQPRY